MRKTVVTDRTVTGALPTRSVGWPIGDPSILCSSNLTMSRVLLSYIACSSAIAHHIEATYTLYNKRHSPCDPDGDGSCSRYRIKLIITEIAPTSQPLLVVSRHDAAIVAQKRCGERISHIWAFGVVICLSYRLWAIFSGLI